MRFSRRLLLAFLLLACALPQALAAQAARGVLALPQPPAEVVELSGEWGFAWQRFVDPDWRQLPTRAFAPVGPAWNDLTADGKPPGPDGWGSYVLLVDCPRGQRYALGAGGERTATRMYVNGELVTAYGEPGTSAASARPMVHRTALTRAFECPLRITVHLSNFSHRAGGMVRAVPLGTPEVLAQAREERIVQDSLLLGAYLLTGLVAIIFFAAHGRERAPLVFGLFCAAMAVYGDLTSEQLVLWLLPPEIPWDTYLRIEYIAWFASMVLFTWMTRELFPAELPVRFVQAVAVLLGAGTLVVLATPSRIYSHLAPAGQLLALVIGVLVTARLMLAASRGRTGATVLLVGMLAVVLTLGLDIVFYNLGGPTRRFTPLGMLLFVLSPAVVLARRLARALNAEQRSLALEENARLRDEVERMSRHDLKTPLSSIIGVAHLLREDRRLAPEHLELVGVIERAGYRMLEMVNLSLGLFKMETGRYDFRPQAVNLAEVLARVMVDMHGLAEANKVQLRLARAQPQPVYARAEELLCYSIVANLVKNAVEATPPGGTVTLDLQGGDPVRLRVENPGRVPPAVAERFFEKYVTAGKSGGTGLGTYSARLMARAQQGELTMASGDAEGTVLTLALKPLSPDALPAAAVVGSGPAAPAVAATDFAPRHVLVVDDDEYNRLVLRRFLPTPPFTVETAVNGQAAIESVARRWPDFLLIDMEMPVMNGLDAVAWVRRREQLERRARMPIVMLSSNDDAASMQRGLQAGADRFITKPVSREALLAALRELDPRPGAAPAAPSAGLAPGVPDAPGPEDEVLVDPDIAGEIEGFLKSRRQLVEGMEAALKAARREELRGLAHRAGGGLALYGFQWAAAQSRDIEKGALAGEPAALQAGIDALREHLRTVRVRPQPALAAGAQAAPNTLASS